MSKRARRQRRVENLSMYQPVPKPEGTCTKETSRCPKTTDPSTGNLWVPSCCRSHIRDLFNAGVDAFEQADVTWMVDYGTLLGAIREGDFIPHDDDADFSMLEDDADKVRNSLQQIADERGYDLRESFGGHGLQLYLSKVNDLHVDFFFWYENGDFMDRKFYVAGTDDNKGRVVPKNWFFDLTTAEMDGRVVRVPKNAEEWLAYRYGDTWREPLRIFRFNNTPNTNKDRFR